MWKTWVQISASTSEFKIKTPKNYLDKRPVLNRLKLAKDTRSDLKLASLLSNEPILNETIKPTFTKILALKHRYYSILANEQQRPERIALCAFRSSYLCLIYL